VEESPACPGRARGGSGRVGLYVDSSALPKRYVDEPDSDAAEDLRALWIVELDEVTCETAAGIAEMTGVRTLDALHLAAAQRAGGPGFPFLTFDVRQAQAARTLGLAVVGA
jgi:predicted nucleic acid-binding protein